MLRGIDNSSVAFDYSTALAGYWCCYIITKDDLLFLADYFKMPLSDANASALAEAMPQIDCTLTCPMMGTQMEGSEQVESEGMGWVIVGSFLGGAIGGIGGFFIAGPLGAGAGFLAGYAVGMEVGQRIPSSSDTGRYKLSTLEKENSLVG